MVRGFAVRSNAPPGRGGGHAGLQQGARTERVHPACAARRSHPHRDRGGGRLRRRHAARVKAASGYADAPVAVVVHTSAGATLHVSWTGEGGHVWRSSVPLHAGTVTV